MISRYSLVFIFCVLGLTSSLFGQRTDNYPELEKKFRSHEVVRINTASVYNKVTSSTYTNNLEFVLPEGRNVTLTLFPSDIISADYILNEVTESGITNRTGTTARPMHGFVNGINDSEAALTFNHNFVYGFVRIRSVEYYIEPVSHLIGRGDNEDFVLYKASDVIQTQEYKCAYDLDHEKGQEIHDSHEHDGSRTGMCIEIRYAIASDWSMRVKYGSVTGVENHNIGVLNDVQTNYDNEFADELSFSIVQQFVVNCSTCDPWSSSTDAETLLISFRNWGPSGFSSTHDLGCLWTNRDLDGSTIGIAYVGVLCTPLRYHVLQDFSSNAPLLRCMSSHEIGHNFNASHDAQGSPTIMAPSVSNTNSWSSASISAIQGEYMTASCLGFCPGSPSAPVANFTFSVISNCTPGQVQYTDNSTNAVSRSWSFPGGTPSTSTALNPLVSYNNTGTYGATLTVFNSAGTSNSITINNIVTVISLPDAAFSFSTNGLTAFFSFSGTGAESYSWDFGDGTNSNLPNPQHTYPADGVYNVTLAVTNTCGTDLITQQVTISTPPTANFSSNVQSGCGPLTVNYINQSSSNSSIFFWNFPGGTPVSSTLQNPTVVYNSPGSYNVTLTVTNSVGSDNEVKTSYITVMNPAVPAFASTVTGANVVFNNVSLNSSTYLWDFGDGQTSTATNPTHTYTSNGTFTVTLTASNSCGPVSFSQQVTIAVPPVASFTPAGSQNICLGQSVQFTNTSTYGPNTYQWTFEGGTPATSSAANPNVQYSTAGIYDVTLTVTNAFGTNTVSMADFVTVTANPVASSSQSVSGLTVQFTSSSQNAAGVLWNFGDGQTSTAQNPVHTYASEGSYNVVLTVNNVCGNASASSTVTLLLPPVASFAASATNICPGQTVTYTNQSSSNSASYQWIFEGGTPGTSTASNPVIAYSSPGNFDVTLIATNAAGSDTFALQNLVTVAPLATVAFTQTADSLTLQFTSQVQNSNTLLWNFGDGQTSTYANPSHTYAAQGSYTVTLTATNQCGPVTFSKTILVVLEPVAMFGLSANPVCQGQAVTFNNLSSANSTTFQWTFEGGNPSTSTEENPVVSYAAPGSYDVALTVTNPSGQNTLSIPNYITVIGPPPTGFQAAVSDNVISLSNTAAPVDSVVWTVTGNGISQTLSGNLVNVTVPQNGSYSVVQTTYGLCGSSQSAATSVAVSGFVTASFSAATGCPGQAVTVSNNSTNATSYQWILEGGTPPTSGDAVPAVTYSAPGTYPVILIASNGFSTDTFISSVTVIPPPVASFDFQSNGGQADFTFTGSNATDVSWEFGDGSKGNGTNVSHTYAKTGQYTVTVKAVNACGESVATKIVSVIVSSTYDNGQAGFEVLPNPNNGRFFAKLSSVGSGTATFRLSDISGKLLETGEIKAVNSFFQKEFNIDQNVPAVLILMIREDDTMYRKLVISGLR